MNEEQRQKLIQIIHIGKSKLGLSDDEYRQILYGCSAGKTSCSAMHIGELKNVLAALKKLGFKVEGSRRFGGKKRMPVTKQDQGLASAEQLSYIKGLWELCAQVKTDQALNKFVKRIAKVEGLQYLSRYSAQPVINALRTMAAAAGFDPDSPAGRYM